MAHPSLDIRPEFLRETADSGEIVKILINNKVLSRTIAQAQQLQSCPKKDFAFQTFSQHPDWEKMCLKVEKTKAGALQAVELLNRNGIASVFIKMSKSIPLDSDNFDLLVHPQDLPLIDQVLNTSGYMEVDREGYKVLYRKIENGDDYIALHLHTKIAWYGIEFLDCEQIWGSFKKKKIDGVNVGFINPKHLALVTAAHAFFENAEIKLSDILCMVDSLSEPGIFDETLSISERLNWSSVYQAILSFADEIHRDTYDIGIIEDGKNEPFELKTGKEKTDLNKIRGMIHKKYSSPFLPVEISGRAFRVRKMLSYVLFSDQSLSEKQSHLNYFLFTTFLGNLKRKLIPQSPFIVSIMGADGVGKTTNALKIKEEFYSRGKSGLYVWSRGASPLLRALFKFSTGVIECEKHQKRDEPRRIIVAEEKRGNLFKNPIIRKVLVSASLFDYGLFMRLKFFSLRNGRNPPKVVIFDRYMPDIFIDSVFSFKEDPQSRFSEIASRSLNLLAPKPDVTILLRASPKILFERRPSDFSSDEFEERISVYDRYGYMWCDFSLDTSSNSFKKSRLIIIENVLAHYYSDFYMRPTFLPSVDSRRRGKQPHFFEGR